MSAVADTLRKIAADARAEADRADESRREKAAHVIRAAVGLEVLRNQMKGTK
jgi:hypothetical protein